MNSWSSFRMLHARGYDRTVFLAIRSSSRAFHSSPVVTAKEPRLEKPVHLRDDEFAILRQNYKTPKNPIILAHGLLGFSELHLIGEKLPGIQYWRGITKALAMNGIEVITANVPPSGSIEARAEHLAQIIALKANGKAVNIIAGLDSRYMISRLQPENLKVLSLTTIATPHRGSAFADYVFETLGPTRTRRIYKAMDYIGLDTGAFRELTRTYMQQEFNPKTPDAEGTRYFSYGATADPPLWSLFRFPHGIIMKEEGPNDGLVSVDSSTWGSYKGTLVNVSHLDLINWTSRLKWIIWELYGKKRHFNAIAFYLSIADMLADENL